jgi:hypothetical protein
MLGVVAVVALTIWGYASIGPRGRLDPGRTEEHKTDFTVFTEAGAAFFDGRDPYKVSNPRGWYYLYPPLFALLVAPLSIFDTASQAVIWFVFNAVLAFGCIDEGRRLWLLVAGAEARRFRVHALCAGLAVFLPFLDCMQAGQLGISILYLLMLGFRLVVQSRSWLSAVFGGLILALPAVVKLVPALPVLFLLFQRWFSLVFAPERRRPTGQAIALSIGVASGSLVFLIALPATLIGWHKNLDYLRVWHARVVANERVGPNANFNIHSYRNQSLANAVFLWTESTGRTAPRGVPPVTPRHHHKRIVHPSVRLVIGVVLILLLGVGSALARKENDLDRATAFGLACGATLMVSPLSWGHYYMVQLPALICVPIWLARRGMTRLSSIATIIPALACWAHYVAMPYAGAIGLLGLVTAAWYLAILGAIVMVELTGALGIGRRPADDERELRGMSRPHVLEHKYRWARLRGGAGRVYSGRKTRAD